MGRKVLTLEIKPDYSFGLAGIICPFRDYQVCFDINRLLGIRLQRSPDFLLNLEKKGSTSYFPLFSDRSEYGDLYTLIGNKGTNGIFVPELKSIDYFLMFNNVESERSIRDIVNHLRNHSKFSSAIEVDPRELKSADNFLMIDPA